MAAIIKSGVATNASNKGPKRRNERNILTFYEKIAVIRYYNETNISRNSLAKMFHCCATQIRRILEKKQELLQQLATMSEADASIILEEMTRKRRKFEMSAISFILHQWVERCRQLRLRKSITNQTLKETALKMAAILNLPAFRPSYRWLNRFRGKYKYEATDLGGLSVEAGGIAGELAVEDIIIEFKDALPSFMQKEISAITGTVAKSAVEDITEETNPPITENSLLLESSEDEHIEAMNKVNAENEADKQGIAKISAEKPGVVWDADLENSNSTSTTSEETTLSDDHNEATTHVSATALMDGIFPHLAVIHQFALLNADVKALELISQLGVHMQTQAAAGAYKELSLATASAQLQSEEMNAAINGGIYADIDDIVLME